MLVVEGRLGLVKRDDLPDGGRELDHLQACGLQALQLGVGDSVHQQVEAAGAQLQLSRGDVGNHRDDHAREVWPLAPVAAEAGEHVLGARVVYRQPVGARAVLVGRQPLLRVICPGVLAQSQRADDLGPVHRGHVAQEGVVPMLEVDHELKRVRRLHAGDPSDHVGHCLLDGDAPLEVHLDGASIERRPVMESDIMPEAERIGQPVSALVPGGGQIGGEGGRSRLVGEQSVVHGQHH